MKVIFLDMDGVLNSSDHWYREEQLINPDESCPELIDPDKVRLLEKIIRSTGARLVLSSNWRESYRIVTLHRMFMQRHFAYDIDIWHGVTLVKPEEDCPRGTWYARGLEIEDYLEANPKITQYVILDDNNVFSEHQQKFVVETDPQLGLTEEDVQKAIGILEWKQ